MIQVLAISIAEAAVYTLVAIGFSIVYSTVRFFNFAHAAVYTLAAYSAYSTAVSLGLGWWAGLICGILIAGISGGILEIIIYRTMRRVNSTSTALFIASLGLVIAIQNTIALIYGDGALILRRVSSSRIIDIFGARVTQAQLERLALTIIMCAFLWALRDWSTLGRKIRAVANDPDLAKTMGVDVEGVILVVFAVASGVAGLAGIMFAHDTDLHPNMGLQVFLMSVVAMVIGGGSSIPGIVLGACLVSILRNTTIWLLPAQWGEGIVFALLILFLLIRPVGFSGALVRRAHV